MDDPSKLYTIIQEDLPASNGIIHIIDQPITNTPSDKPPRDEQYADITIGEILTKDGKYNRFLSLVDNCGSPLPLRGPGPLTVFIPTNQAVDRARDGSILYMLNDLTVDELAALPRIQTMANQIVAISVSGDGKILLGEKGVQLASTNIMASNGIIHMIDGLLYPPSILPILPHRCDVVEHKITVGPCVHCSYLYETDCPEGSTELAYHQTGCEYVTSPLRPTLSPGCAKFCNTTKQVAECCKGFYGPDCKPCIGGFQHPCYDKGTCLDGIHGNGSCSCQSNFKGVACHICSDPSKFGEKCDEECHCVHGVCDNRPGSGGVCRRGSCLEGYSGENCDKTATPCNSDGLQEHCHIHAYCTHTGLHTTCVCKDGYDGDGHSCSPINPCLKSDRGGCDINAKCAYLGPGNASCVCNEGWTGDGKVCVEINNCQLKSRGGCSPNADCNHIGPGQAKCEVREGGTHTCTCSDGYAGDGTICYGSLLDELDMNIKLYSFHRLIQKYRYSSEDLSGNITVFAPSRDALRNITSNQEPFWTSRHRFCLTSCGQSLYMAHFLPGIYSIEDLDKLVGTKLPTLNPPTQWEISNSSGVILIGNASIITHNMPAINGYIHIVDKARVSFVTVLAPSRSDLPPEPSSLMAFLNSSSSFTLFRQYFLMYNLSEELKEVDFTLLLPTDDAIREHLSKTNSSVLDSDLCKYHVINNELLFPDHLSDGMVKSTLLGNDYQVQFHLNNDNQTVVNDVPLDGTFIETQYGVIMILPQVLKIRRSRCSKEVTLQVNGRCADCEGPPRCLFSYKPIKPQFPSNMRSNCKYRKRVGSRRKSVPGCVIKCLRITTDHSCCPGYYGHECFKCPGDVGSWCSNHGECQDGNYGNGECRCYEGFHGTACENCEPGRYGVNCSSKCVCDHTGSVRMVWREVVGVCVTKVGKDPPALQRSKTTPAEVCVTRTPKIDGCLVNNGGCHKSADCIRTGPNTNNGGCSRQAHCEYLGQGQRNCTCHIGYVGDGFECRGNINNELFRRPENAFLRRMIIRSDNIRGLYGDGPYTVFVPMEETNNDTSFMEWYDFGRLTDLIHYHIISCETFTLSDLKTSNLAVATSGHTLHFSLQQGSVWINNRSRIVKSDYTTFNGVIHHIDTMLTPYRLYDKPKLQYSSLNLTTAAAFYGYSRFYKLVEDAGLLPVLQMSLHQPLTMFWPTDEAINALSAERQRWLFSPDHQEQLAATVKAHIIRNSNVLSIGQQEKSSYRTMHGSTIKFSCDKTVVGAVLINDNAAKVVERYLKFKGGVAYGIDQLLEPPGLGAHCDSMDNRTSNGRCGRCFSPPQCPFRQQDTGRTERCLSSRTRFGGGYTHWYPDLDHFSLNCRRICQYTFWTLKCCKNHYGRDCQVCPGGVEAPCGNHGDCDDGLHGSGRCRCHDGFRGHACELCVTGHYGPNCTACSCGKQGRCEDGIDGSGQCVCIPGWKGDRCQIDIGSIPEECQQCHNQADCVPGVGCQCKSGFQGNGTFCSAEPPPDLCAEYNGGCHQNADCNQTGLVVNCTCRNGYQGDGFSCDPVNRCVEEQNGGCSDFATCKFTGPNERECECLPGYVGNGVQCMEKVVPPVDRCLENNGDCDPAATCKDLHYHGNTSVLICIIVEQIPNDPCYHANTAGVFHLRSPEGKYKMNFSQADAACQAEGATLATFKQLGDAQQLGMHLCVAGWMEGGKVGYPTRFPSVKCGDNHVGLVIYREPVDQSSMYDAYCYRLKDVSCACPTGYVGNGAFCNGVLTDILATNSDFSVFYKRRVSQDSPTTSRDLRYSGRISSTPGALPPRSLLNYLSDFGSGDGRVHLRVPSPCFLTGRQQVGGIEEILEVFLPPPTDSPPPWPHRTPPRPEFLPPGPPGLRLAWPAGAPVNCVRSPTGQHGPIGLLLQPDMASLTLLPVSTTGFGGLPPRQAPETLRPQLLELLQRRQWRQRTWSTRTQCPQPPSESVRSSSGGGVEDLPDRGLGQMFPTDPHNTFGSARDWVVEAPCHDCYPNHIAPVPHGPSCGCRAYWKAGPRRHFGLSPAGSRGQRPGHQALACEPQPQAWLQGGAPCNANPGDLLLDYSGSSSEGKKLVEFLSHRKSEVTLFVPRNDGFGQNKTLSGRDLEYHISANNSRRPFKELRHQEVIVSRLGFNLTVTHGNNESYKMVNQQRLLIWDIPAVNGLIHMIEAPLTAPPAPVSKDGLTQRCLSGGYNLESCLRGDSAAVAMVIGAGQMKCTSHHASRGHAHTSGTVSAILVSIFLACLLAALGYYLFKHKTDAFRFHYFRNEDEDGAPGGRTKPTLVSIPNPLYSGSRAFSEPFAMPKSLHHPKKAVHSIQNRHVMGNQGSDGWGQPDKGNHHHEECIFPL
ncbi:hypothetical protein L3Q82_024579, partial [Scortum barcoo]